MNVKNLCIGIVTLLLTAAAPAHGQERSAMQVKNLLERHDREVRQHLQEAAAAARVKLESRSITRLNASGAATVVSALAGLESVSDTTLAKGVNVAFGFFDLPQERGGVGPSLPSGFYTIRITASEQTADDLSKRNAATPLSAARGRIERPSAANAWAEFVDASRKVVARVPAAFGVWERDTLSRGNEMHTVVVSPGAAQITSFCMRLGNGAYWVCWGSNWMDALDALL
jgi:hypothetical protein